jgi:hypothetical protein
MNLKDAENKRVKLKINLKYNLNGFLEPYLNKMPFKIIYLFVSVIVQATNRRRISDKIRKIIIYLEKK